MTTTNRQKLLSLLLFCCSAFGLQSAEKPNILFIAVDDLRPDFGENRSTWVKTPNIDNLQSEGLYFDKAYCQYPVCGPSRSSVMTGLLPDSSGIYGFENADSKVGQVTILPQLFKNHGYVTGRFGKVFNNPMDFKEAWDVIPPEVQPEGYTWMYHLYVLPENREKCREVEATPADMSQGKNQTPKPPAIERADYPDEDYIDFRNTSEAIDFIKNHRQNPFFCAIGFKKPHLPFSAPERCWKLYDNIEIPYATNPFLPKRIQDWMACNWEELRSYSDIPDQGLLTLEKEKELIQGYYASVSFVDDQIKRLLDTLDEFNLRENTIIVFWSDNGFHLGENGIWAKHVNWEFTNRLPLIISTPDMKAKGKITNALVELIDLFPTLADLAGLPKPEHLNGRSLLPLLDNPYQNWEHAALSQYLRGDKMCYSIRTKRYRYSEWRKTGTSEVLGRELYDLQNDPEGNVNIESGIQYKTIIQDHAKILQRLIDRKD